MILIFLKRRWWLTQQRLFSTIGFALLLPVLLHISINLSMKYIVVRSIRNIPYEAWVFPGLLLFIATVSLFPLLYRDFFDLRIHNKILTPISMTPLSKPAIIMGILSTAILESLFFVLIGMVVFSILMSISFSFGDYLIMISYIILFDFIMGNLFISLSLLTGRVTLLIVFTVTIFCVVLFGSGLLVDFEFYPHTVGTIFRNLPTGMLIRGLRTLLFERIFYWIPVVVPVIIIVIWLFINSELLRRKLKQ